jgi:hypothetical protein
VLSTIETSSFKSIVALEIAAVSNLAQELLGLTHILFLN